MVVSKMFEASREIRRQRSTMRYKGDASSSINSETGPVGIITKKNPETAKHSLAEFEIERVDLKYDVQVKSRTDNGRLQVTITNQIDRKD